MPSVVTVAQLFRSVVTVAQPFPSVMGMPVKKQSASRKATRARLNRLNNKQGGNNG